MYQIYLGGVFTGRSQGNQYYLRKDRDIPNDVLALGGLGVVGSDVLGELPEQSSTAITDREIGAIIDKLGNTLRFALLAEAASKHRVETLLSNGCSVGTGTSYPRASRDVMGGRCALQRICAGGAEALPSMYPEVDVIFETYQSGRSAAENKLVELDTNVVFTLMPKMQESITLRAIIPVGAEDIR